MVQGVRVAIGAEFESFPREGQNAEDKAERLMAATCHLLEDVIALFRQRSTSTLCWPLEACECLNTQGRAEHLTAETHHPFEVVMTICHPPGIAEEVLLFEEMMATIHPLGIAGPPNFQEDETLFRETLENRGRSLSAEKHVHIVCGQVDCQQQKVSWLTNGAESESFHRGRECFTSAQKHMFIVFAS